MPMYNVYMRQKIESCIQVEDARDEQHAMEIARNGGGEQQWRDEIEFVDEDRWHAERLDDDEEEDDEPRDAPQRVEPAALHDLGERLARQVAERNAQRRARVAEPVADEAEEVDFNG